MYIDCSHIAPGKSATGATFLMKFISTGIFLKKLVASSEKYVLSALFKKV